MLHRKTQPGGAGAQAELPSICHEAPSALMAVWHNVVIVVWNAQATMALIAELDKTIARGMLATGKFSALHVALGGMSPPDSQVRAALDLLTKRVAPSIVGSALVVTGGGFRASALRSFVTGLQLVRERDLRVHVFSSIDEVASWLPPIHAESGVSIEVAELRTILQGLVDRATAAAR